MIWELILGNGFGRLQGACWADPGRVQGTDWTGKRLGRLGTRAYMGTDSWHNLKVLWPKADGLDREGQIGQRGVTWELILGNDLGQFVGFLPLSTTANS